MKTVLLSILLFVSVSVKAQDVVGKWHGALNVHGTQLRLVFTITKNGVVYSSTMDSPDQGANGIAVASTEFNGAILKIKLPNLGITYQGTLHDGKEIKGTFTQGGQDFPLNISRTSIDAKVYNRPQEPTQPYPYYSEDVTFTNTLDKVQLAGTLTLPKENGKFPAVILISGSGPQDRDETLLEHKPFLVLSDYLTRKGIAVLRYDDRGTAKSTGDFGTATSLDFSRDVSSAIEYLKSRKEIIGTKIGLLGHSEGGLIAPMVATSSEEVRFIVLLAGTGIQGNELLLQQQELILRASGISNESVEQKIKTNRVAFDIVLKNDDTELMKTELTNYFKKVFEENLSMVNNNSVSKEQFIASQVKQTTSPWMQYFIKYDPTSTLMRVKCPVLAVNGSKDLQVPADTNLNAIKESIEKGGNTEVTIIKFEGLNHLFQECKTGLPQEYKGIEQTFSPLALDKITTWILGQTE